jgi:hypothetical protein
MCVYGEVEPYCPEEEEGLEELMQGVAGSAGAAGCDDVAATDDSERFSDVGDPGATEVRLRGVAGRRVVAARDCRALGGRALSILLRCSKGPVLAWLWLHSGVGS